MAGESLHDSEAMHRFAGLELGEGRIPDETTILNFRRFPERHALTEAIFGEVKHLSGLRRACQFGRATVHARRVIAAIAQNLSKAANRIKRLWQTPAIPRSPRNLFAGSNLSGSGKMKNLETGPRKDRHAEVFARDSEKIGDIFHRGAGHVLRAR